MSRLRVFSLVAAVLLLGACSPGTPATPTTDPNALATSVFATAMAASMATGVAMHTATPTVTLTSTPPPPPTLSPTPMPTTPPVDAVASSNVTVRSQPRKGADNLGGVFFNQGIKVLARNDAGSWYYIVWSKSPTGTAWVLAKAINLGSNDLTKLSIAIYDNSNNVVILPPMIWTITGTPLPLNTPASGARTALVNALAMVRVGPGPGYSSMGTINPGATVVVSGRVSDNSWFQIDYPSGPGGKGWVSGELIHVNDPLGGLQFFNILATPISDQEAKGGGGGGGGNAPTVDPNATAAPTPTPQPTPAGPTGVVIDASELAVHDGPASSFATLGTLKANAPVVVTGETINKLWYQIVYAAGTGGYGWVSTKYIRITGGDLTKLHYFDTQGTPLPGS